MMVDDTNVKEEAMAIQGSAADVTHALKGIDFPCDKRTVVEYARKNNADQPSLESLEKLPDQQFENMADVMKAFGEVR
jgi:hypothetical protein